MTVTLVAGPPCAGKSTYVSGRRQPDDLVLDYDVIARGHGSRQTWRHTRAAAQRAGHAMRLGIAMVPTITDRDVWVIRCVARAAEREALAAYIKADRVMVLVPPTDVLMARAAERPEPDRTRRIIERWLADYQPLDSDETHDGEATTP